MEVRMQQEMKYVYQVYLDGSISRAAEHLYITQPALSIAIQKIENELGMPLFDRSTRPLTLTLAGQIYIEAVQPAGTCGTQLRAFITDADQSGIGPDF